MPFCRPLSCLTFRTLSARFQVLRRRPRQKPDLFLRKQPTREVVKALLLLKDVILFSPDAICGEGDVRYCYCGLPASLQMVQCDECAEWYHYKCAGVTAANVRGDAEYQRGYCLGEQNDDGLQVWLGDVMRGRKVVRKVVIPDRDPNLAPSKLPKKKGGRREWFGPCNWAELVEQIRAHSADIKKKIEKQVKAVEGLAGGAGHHIGDHVVAGRLEARDITPDLLDELVVLGEIDEGSDDD